MLLNSGIALCLHDVNGKILVLIHDVKSPLREVGRCVAWMLLAFSIKPQSMGSELMSTEWQVRRPVFLYLIIQ